ncbi:S-methyl-5'-thioadenosine phosphorylase [Patescibacteria group bacterium]|nr:S-methyl-5'-thioadenosine phosphorylase [Patescibacteria group bacterium]
MNLDLKIRKIPNWPKPGVLFYDVTTLFEDREAFRYVVDEMCKPYLYTRVDKIVGIDARGFLLASSMAYKLGAGVSIVRKKGKLPYKTIARDYSLEYGEGTVEMHEDTIKPGERVIIVDDLVATGGTMKATCELVEQLGGVIVGVSWLVDLPFLHGSEKLVNYQCHYLIKYESEEIDKKTTLQQVQGGEKQESKETSEQVFPEPCVGAFIFDEREKLFLMKSHKWNNQYMIPGGHVELGESMKQALAREVKEETGMDLDFIKFLLHLEAIFPKEFYKKRHFIFFDFYCRASSSQPIILNSEAESYAWIEPAEALKLDLEPYTRKTIEYYLKNKDIVAGTQNFVFTKIKPKIGIIGGSGLENLDILQDKKEEKVNTPYGRTSDVVVTGRIGDPSASSGHFVDVVIIPRHGREHTIKPTDVNYRANIWAMKELGVTHILAPTACGSLKEEIKPGDFVILDQFIDRTTKREQTFYEGRVCHIPMAEPFCPKLRELIYKTAQQLGIRSHKWGTIITIEGPRFSTKAESYIFRQWGADVVNMTTVPEVVLAREAGICYAAIAMATDYDCWREASEAVTIEMILETMKENAQNMKKLLVEVISKIDYIECGCRETIKTAVL